MRFKSEKKKVTLIPYLTSMVHSAFRDGSPNHDINMGKHGEMPSETPTTAYICLQPWVSVDKRQGSADVKRIC